MNSIFAGETVSSQRWHQSSLIIHRGFPPPKIILRVYPQLIHRVIDDSLWLLSLASADFERERFASIVTFLLLFAGCLRHITQPVSLSSRRGGHLLKQTTAITSLSCPQLFSPAHSFRTVISGFPLHHPEEFVRAVSAFQNAELRPDNAQCRPHQVRSLPAPTHFKVSFERLFPILYADMMTLDPKASLRSTSERRRVLKRRLRNASMFVAASCTHGITSLLGPSGRA